MAKPTPTSFSEEFEPILVSAWAATGERLSESQMAHTRKVVVELRHLYRFRNEPVTRVRYSVNRNRAGYLAAFGQRHAYLLYEHLRQADKLSPGCVPEPDGRGELTVTLLGAGAALEVYGLCLFYNELSSRLKRLRLNCLEKVEEWRPTRLNVVGHLLKDKFPKVNVFARDIDMDLTDASGVQRLANHHDDLVRTNILVIYNVLNEIKAEYANRVWKNLQYILRQAEGPLLVVLAEPNAPKARPRMEWLVERLSECSHVRMYEPNATVLFDHEPVKIAFEGTREGLNDRLFGRVGDGSKPILQTSIVRTLFASTLKPFSPVPAEIVARQLAVLRIKRGKKGRFARDQYADEDNPQLVLTGWREPSSFIAAAHQLPAGSATLGSQTS